MIILGLNAFHGDSAACIVRDGVLIAAAEEERFRRLKHWAGFPAQAIAYCLKEAGVALGDVDHLAINQNNSAHLWRKVLFMVGRRPNPALIRQKLRFRAERSGIDVLLRQEFPGQAFAGQIHQVEHHLCHLYSAYYVSAFEDAAVVSVDGFGDFASAAWGHGQRDSLRVDGQVFFPHSLGVFYQAFTQYLGFPHYGDEYKVMGLAPYGAPSLLAQLRQIVELKSDGSFTLNLRYFRHHIEEVPFHWMSGSPDVGENFSPALEALLGPRRRPDEALEQRHFDLARSVQAMYEEAFFNLIDAVQRRTGATDLALAGGCAANSVANGKVRRQTRFRRVYVQSAAGDAGGAIGAAFAVWQRQGGKRSFRMDHAYWGPHFDAAEIAQLVAARRAQLDASLCRTTTIAEEAELCQRTARHIADGKVVGWFQGRMEWGPRALGNRSIVCDPRRADMKDILNAKIKRRESFRPFAPSVLDREVANWFEEDDAVPFMMQVFQIREDKRPRIPAVTHVDGSGRLQTVSAATNPRYHRLIEEFFALSGVPMVLNTSFNENEPVVCRPEEALECFLRTRMDVLVLGDVMIERQSEA